MEGLCSMIDSSITHCSNENCSKKDSCLRYTTENDNIKSETYLVLTEEECNKSKSYINKDDYYKKMIMNIIDEVPNDDLDNKMLLQICNSLLDISKKYDLEKKLKEKIRKLESK